MNEATNLLSAIQQGDPHASEQLLPLDEGLIHLTEEEVLKAELDRFEIILE